MSFLSNCFLSITVLIGLSLRGSQGSQGLIKWVPQDNCAIKLFCHIDKTNITFEYIDNKINQRWQDKKIPFFSPYSIQSTKLQQCATEKCDQCPSITTEQWNLISSEQEQWRKNFLYIPMSALQNNDGSWKKNGDLLFYATIADKSYAIYLAEQSSSYSEEQNKKCGYDIVLQRFHEQQEKKIISKMYDNRMLLIWLLGVALPFYACCEKKEIKHIFMFTVINCFLKCVKSISTL